MVLHGAVRRGGDRIEEGPFGGPSYPRPPLSSPSFPRLGGLGGGGGFSSLYSRLLVGEKEEKGEGAVRAGGRGMVCISRVR